MGDGITRWCAKIMKKMTIGIVAEDPTDSLLIELLINQLLETEHSSFSSIGFIDSSY